MSHGGHGGRHGGHGGGMSMLVFLILAWIILAPFALVADMAKLTQRRKKKYPEFHIDSVKLQKDCEWMMLNPLPEWAFDKIMQGECVTEVWYRGVKGCPE